MMRGFSRHRQMCVTYPLLVLISLIGLLPFYWMVACSFKTNENMFLMPLQWFPNPINWHAYGDAWKAQDFTRYFLNTIIMASGSSSCMGPTAANAASSQLPGATRTCEVPWPM